MKLALETRVGIAVLAALTAISTVAVTSLFL